jgi:hypothetical protein
MTRDDITRMAREAQTVYATETWTFALSVNALERFAALVAAAEREACAKLCEEIAKRNETEGDFDWVPGNMECAAAIRARVDK